MGTRFLKSGVVVIACLLSLAPGAGVGFASGPDNGRVSRDHQAGSYTRYDGGSDATMTACSTGKRAQNEPSVAVNPHNPSVVVAGSTYVATYDQDGGHYLRTVLVAQGSPAGQFSSGLFQDKINLAVDQTTGSNSGNVYLAWSRYSGRAANNVVLFSRSTDHGVTFSPPVRISPGLGEESFSDLAVGPRRTGYP